MRALTSAAGALLLVVSCTGRGVTPPGAQTETQTGATPGAGADRAANAAGPSTAAPTPPRPPPPDVYAFAETARQLFVGAGDIASCSEQGDEESAKMLDKFLAVSPGMQVFTTGDNVYGSGTPDEFRECYAPTWGRHLQRTYPSIGNHDAYSDNGKPYHEYFGARAGTWSQSWIAHELAGWKLIALNSNCNKVDCSAGGEQARWLEGVLDAHEGDAVSRGGKTACTVAFWHHPRFSSGPHGDARVMQDLWRIMAEHDVELVLNGHDHDYERFTELDAQGAPNPAGIVQVVVGTGGKEPYPFGDPHLGSVVRHTNMAGLLALDLMPEGYRGRFAGTDAIVRDAFEGRCK